MFLKIEGRSKKVNFIVIIAVELLALPLPLSFSDFISSFSALSRILALRMFIKGIRLRIRSLKVARFFSRVVISARTLPLVSRRI
jgi:hypothetical protein